MATFTHIYVCDNGSFVGTNTGSTDTSQETQQTGNITGMSTANVYATLGAAVAGANPSDGDTIYVCNNHDVTYDNDTINTANVSLNASGTEAGAGLKIVSVDNTNINQYMPGASENLSDTGDDFIFNRNGISAGVNYETGDNVITATTASRHWRFLDLTIVVDGNNDLGVSTTVDGVDFVFTNFNINTTASNITEGLFNIAAASRVVLNGGAIGGQGISSRLFLSTAFGNGGGTFIANGYDLSLVDGKIGHTCSASTVDSCHIRYNNCLIHADAILPTPGTDLLLPYHRFEIFNTDNATDKAYHRFIVSTGSGSAFNSDSVYVSANPGFNESSNKSSIKITTSSRCSHMMPFDFELPARYADLSNAASDKISINIVTDFALTDTDIAFFLMYPDGTTQVQANWLSSGKNVGTGNYGTDPIAAGSALNTTGALVAGDWTGEPGTPTFYLVELDTVVDAGAACVPTIRIEVYKASIDGAAGGLLYIDPVLAVGT